jgi:diadenosine tetraphosphate (Ap4A) HIT family hydrolase
MLPPDAGFALHPRLAADCRLLGDLPLCRLLLMNDHRFPWCILVPRRAGLTEWHHVTGTDREALMTEIEAVSRALLDVRDVAKINVGALGNVVSQLHVHVVGRRPDDAAWPGPVWGSGAAAPYEPDALTELAGRLSVACGVEPVGRGP